MPRAIASAQIAFGLVSIPVKLFSATESSEKISFNMLHRECGSRIQQQLFCPNEVRAIDELELGEAIVKDNELKMAVQLAEMGAAEEFHPENYHDEVSDRIRAVIQQKVEGQEITATEAEQPRAQVIDLMEALKASLASPQRKQTAAARVARLPVKSDQKRKAPKAAPRNAKVVAKASSRSR